MGDNESALRDYSRVIELNPGDYQAYYNRGNIYFESFHFEQALADYEQATTINPEYAQAYFKIGAIYDMQSRYQDALPFFEKALQFGEPAAAQTVLRIRHMLSMD